MDVKSLRQDANYCVTHTVGISAKLLGVAMLQILDAFDAMEREGLVLTRVQSWPAELPLDHPGDSHWEVQRRIPGPRYEVVARGDTPPEALLAAAATLETKSDA